MGLAAMIAVLAGTAAVNAQEGEDRMQGFDQPLKGRRGQEGNARSTMVMTESDGEHSYTVKMEGDKVTAEIDGKQVPAERVRKRGGRVEILDEDGDVLKTFNARVMGTTPLATGGPRFQVETLRPGAQGGGLGQWAPPAEPPKAMMGITMTDAEDGGAQIESVMEGLPAEKAGVKAGDRVVKANGREIDGQQDLREIIGKAEPGDTITLTVDRDGKNTELKVKLAKFDQSKIPVARDMPDVFRQLESRGGNIDEARDEVRKALDAMKNAKKLEGEALDKARKALEAALDKLEDVKVQGFRWENNDDVMKLYGQHGQRFVLPPGGERAPLMLDQDMSRQLDRLNAQMEKLNKRLEELEKNRR